MPYPSVVPSFNAYSTATPGTITSNVSSLIEASAARNWSDLPQSSLLTVISSYLIPLVTIQSPDVILSSTYNELDSAESILLESEPGVADVVIFNLPATI